MQAVGKANPVSSSSSTSGSPCSVAFAAFTLFGEGAGGVSFGGVSSAPVVDLVAVGKPLQQRRWARAPPTKEAQRNLFLKAHPGEARKQIEPSSHTLES
eukprot:4185073-Alexandrium_andersonii.AAC.1